MGGSTEEIVLRAAAGQADLARVRTLMREYGEHLAANPAGAANICIAGYEAELAGLPEPYVAPGGLLLALADGEAAGCVALKPLSATGVAAKVNADAGVESALELKRLWVRPGFRGIGLGHRLMEAGIEHARAAGAAAVYLDTVPAAMPEANRLYAAMGFGQVGRYNDNMVADVIFFRLGLGAGLSGSTSGGSRCRRGSSRGSTVAC